MRGTLGSLLLEKKEKDQLASSEKAQRIEAGLFEVFVFLIILSLVGGGGMLYFPFWRFPFLTVK